MDRHWDGNPKVLVLIPLGKTFCYEFTLFTTKQYKVDNIDKFVYYGKTRMIDCSCYFSYRLTTLMQGKF